jgi:hypothetical protein
MGKYEIHITPKKPDDEGASIWSVIFVMFVVGVLIKACGHQ